MFSLIWGKCNEIVVVVFKENAADEFLWLLGCWRRHPRFQPLGDTTTLVLCSVLPLSLSTTLTLSIYFFTPFLYWPFFLRKEGISYRMIKGDVIMDGSDRVSKYLLVQLKQELDRVSYTLTLQRRKINWEFCIMSTKPPQRAKKKGSIYLNPFSLALPCSTSKHLHNLYKVS